MRRRGFECSPRTGCVGPAQRGGRRRARSRHWTSLPYGPFETALAYREWVESVQSLSSEIFFAIIAESRDRPVGVASYLRIAPEMGSIEVGHLRHSRLLQRTTAATEALYLMMHDVFETHGDRRLEWKCDSLNAPSLAAARRLGFRLEGVFRNHLVVKGRKRDTSWLSITVEEWPKIRQALEAWLTPDNFDSAGRERRPLSALMRGL
ncbi:MAG: GNAT family N-acetyltransferase [bacterium]